MILPVEECDLPAVRALIAAAIRRNVARSEEEAVFLVADIDSSLDWWCANSGDALHLKYCVGEEIAGVVLVKEFWNLTNLFIAPRYQGGGIGRALVTEVLAVCRTRSPRGELRVNSSNVATGFYERLGFDQTAPGRDRPGGCVPFRYVFR